MRISRLSALVVVAALALAPLAHARVPDPRPAAPTAQDVNDATYAKPLRRAQDPAVARAEAQQAYYASYRHPATKRPDRAAKDDSPWLVLGVGLGLTFAIAGAVAFGVRSHGRIARVRVS